MLRSYVVLAWRVLWRRKFFTFISLFGICITLVVLMVAVAVLDHMFAPMAPETRQARTLNLLRARLEGEHSTQSGTPGFYLLDTYARKLPGVERMAVFSERQTVYAYRGGSRISSVLRRTDADYWRVLDFTFVEGGPFSERDVADGAMVAVINLTTRDRYFSGGPAVGRHIDADGQRFRVIGVVPDVPTIRVASSGDIYVPITTAKTDAYKRQLIGGCGALLLTRSAADEAGVKSELEARLQRAPLPDKRWTHLYAPAESYFETVAAELLGQREEPRSHPERLWALLIGAGVLFSLLPAVNLINLNTSRILERAAEIGVRKSFGASEWVLMGQFLVENLVVTSAGAAIGLAGSAVVLRAINVSGIIPYARFGLNLRVFGYAVLLTCFFAVLSGVVPAWRMSRLHPVAALKGRLR